MFCDLNQNLLWSIICRGLPFLRILSDAPPFLPSKMVLKIEPKAHRDFNYMREIQKRFTNNGWFMSGLLIAYKIVVWLIWEISIWISIGVLVGYP